MSNFPIPNGSQRKGQMHPGHQPPPHQLLSSFTGCGTNTAHSSPLRRVPQAVSPLASPMESRRMLVTAVQQQSAAGAGGEEHHAQQQSAASQHQHQQMVSALQLGYALAPAQPAKLLVDPHTGQQYFVPTGPAPGPPAFYPQPVFYNQPTAAAFFHHHQPPPPHPSAGYLFHPTPVSSSAGPLGVPFSSGPPLSFHRSQSPPTAYRVDLPPSTVGSTYGGGDRDLLEQQPMAGDGGGQFQRREQIRLSTESRTSGTSSRGGFGHNGPVDHRREQQDDSSSCFARSPPPLHARHNSSSAHSPLASFGGGLAHHQSSLLSAGGGSSSESTSGFASGQGRGARTGDGISEGRSPPQSPLKEQRMSLIFPREEERERERAQPKMKAIRMDIDLSRPMSPPESTGAKLPADSAASSVSLRATVLRTAPPTAFTISFNDNCARPKVSVKEEVSLQEAAQKAPKGRRLMMTTTRRSGPTIKGATLTGAKALQQPQQDSGSECGDPKQWLFRKMMMGRPAQGTAQSRKEETEEGEGDGGDLASEAGTYVVENSQMMSASQISSRTLQKGRQSDSSSCSSSSSRSSSSVYTPSPGTPGQALGPEKRSLMGDLRRLRQQQAVPPSAIKTKVTQQPQRKLQQNQPPPPQTQLARPCRMGAPAQQMPTSRGGQFSRSDGGRFSMRPVRNPPASAPTKGRSTILNVPKQTPEMIAWLRRKEYDPRKAAQADRAQITQAQDLFLANRSVSLSATAEKPANSTNSAFSRWRSQQRQQQNGLAANSHDDLSRLGESIDEESLLGGPDSCSSSLQRTVDELTQKCHKSITLLKLCQQSTLSPSVEQLLTRVAETSGGDVGGIHPQQPQYEGARLTAAGGHKASNENISDRLERLSSAFDAIQKYLEEQTTAGAGTGTNARAAARNSNINRSQNQLESGSQRNQRN